MRLAVNLSNVFVLIYLIGKTLTFIINHILEAIDYKSRLKNGGVLPEILKKYPESELFNKEKLKRICEYENAKYFSWIPRSILGFIVDLSLVFFGFYVFIFNLIISWFGLPQTVGETFLCFFFFNLFLSIPETLFSLPFDLYDEFKLEKKFGFSNMTFKLYLIDGIKNLFVSLILSVLLTFIASLLFVKCSNYWWIVLGSFLLVFVILINIIYPKFIAPLFNKFQPLEDGELKDRLTQMLNKAGFSSDGLFRMDASKRSNHSNAYFSGFGKAKRIVLYDTLIASLTVDEIESVMAHEVGHYKLKHIQRRLFSLFPLIIIVCFAVFTLSHIPSLYSGFGFTVENINAMQFIGIQFSIMIYNSIAFPLTPIVNAFSRKHEYEADKFAAKLCSSEKGLITALLKLNNENLSELMPAKIYSFYHYSHPTLVERTEALENLKLYNS